MASNDIEVLDPAATVEKIKKIASGVALNRRHFMAALGAAGVAAGTGLVSGPVARAQQPTPTGYAQTDVLNFLLNIKYLKGTFYSFVTQGVDLPGPTYITLSSSQVYNQPPAVSFTPFGSYASQIADMFSEMYYDDLNHLINLRSLIETASGATGAAAAAVVAPRPTLNLLGTSPASGPGVSFSAPSTTTTMSGAQAIAMARMFEDLSVTAFAGALQYLSGANLATAAQIMAVDGAHAAALRLTTIQTGAPYQGTFYVGPNFQIATTVGSNTLYLPTTSALTTNGLSHPAVGDVINGFGIPVGATVTAITLTTSNIAPTCYATAGSPILTVIGALPSPAPAAGMTITGSNIPAFTYVTGATSATPLSTITMSQNATASSVETPTGIFTTGTGFNGGNAANNPSLITAISSVTGLVAARGISAAGYLTPNTNAAGTPPNAVFIATTAFTSITATQAVGTITVLMNTPCLKSSTITLTGTIAAGSSTITNISFVSNSSGTTPSIAQVVAPITQPIVVGTGAVPVDPVQVNATVYAPLTLTAAATASGGNTVYTGTITGGGSNAFAGFTFTVASFDNAANNGVFVATASSTTTLTLANANGVADTHAATATSNTVTGIASTSGLTVGQPIYGIASSPGVTPVVTSNITSGTTIKTINSATSITLSSPPTAASTAFLTASVLPPNTTVTGTNTTTNTISLSSNALSAYTGTFTIPWAVPITFVSVTTESVAIGHASITISEPAIATGTGTATIVSPSGDPDEVAPVDPAVIAATVTSGSASVTVTSIAGLAVGQSVSGTGIVAGTTITAVNTTSATAPPYTITLSNQATASSISLTIPALAAFGPAPLPVVPSSYVAGVTPTPNRGFFATAGSANGTVANPAGLAFARTFSQVLSVLYGSTTPGTYFGGFFPTFQANGDSTNTFGGVSGTITMV